MTTTILVGDVRQRLKDIPDGSVQCCVTSPPYYGLRDYGTAQWDGGDADCDHVGAAMASPKSTLGIGKGNASHDAAMRHANSFGVPYRHECGKCGAVRIDSQIGLEPTLAAYIAAMVEVFREVRRVLRDDGVCWLNIGSSYASRIIESDAYVMRDDLTDAERTYVYAELARHFEAESQTLSGVRSIDAPAKQEVSAVPQAGKGTTSELRDEGV